METHFNTSGKLTITGTIVDGNNEPLFAVNIYIKDTKIGTTSDFDGYFKLEFYSGNMSDTSILVCDYLGYRSEEFLISDILESNTSLEVKMEESESIIIGSFYVKRKFGWRFKNFFKRNWKQHGYSSRKEWKEAKKMY